MALTVEITDVTVKNGGDTFQGKMHNVSAKLTLKEGEVIIYEKVFSEKHKDIYSIKDTMNKISIKMKEAKGKIEAEIVIKVEADKELPTMLNDVKGVE